MVTSSAITEGIAVDFTYGMRVRNAIDSFSRRGAKDQGEAQHRYKKVVSELLILGGFHFLVVRPPSPPLGRSPPVVNMRSTSRLVGALAAGAACKRSPSLPRSLKNLHSCLLTYS